MRTEWTAAAVAHPRPAAARAVRVGDRQRERTVTRLGQALSQGYLSITEYEDRLGEVFAAQTAGDLDDLVADLPVERIRRADPQRRAARRRAARRAVRLHLAAYLAVAVLMIGIWAATGAGYFWPVWPILGWGIGVLSHAAPGYAPHRRWGPATFACLPQSRTPPAPRPYWR